MIGIVKSKLNLTLDIEINLYAVYNKNRLKSELLSLPYAWLYLNRASKYTSKLLRMLQYTTNHVS